LGPRAVCEVRSTRVLSVLSARQARQSVQTASEPIEDVETRLDRRRIALYLGLKWVSLRHLREFVLTDPYVGGTSDHVRPTSPDFDLIELTTEPYPLGGEPLSHLRTIARPSQGPADKPSRAKTGGSACHPPSSIPPYGRPGCSVRRYLCFRLPLRCNCCWRLAFVPRAAQK